MGVWRVLNGDNVGIEMVDLLEGNCDGILVGILFINFFLCFNFFFNFFNFFDFFSKQMLKKKFNFDEPLISPNHNAPFR
jgi:hypothetical protein